MRLPRRGGVNIRLISSDITKRVSGAGDRAGPGARGGAGEPVRDAAFASPGQGRSPRPCVALSACRSGAEAAGRRPKRPRRSSPAGSGALGRAWRMPCCGRSRCGRGDGMSPPIRPGRPRTPGGNRPSSKGCGNFGSLPMQAAAYLANTRFFLPDSGGAPSSGRIAGTPASRGRAPLRFPVNRAPARPLTGTPRGRNPKATAAPPFRSARVPSRAVGSGLRVSAPLRRSPGRAGKGDLRRRG